MSAELVERVRARLVANQSEATPGDVAKALRAEGIVLADAAVVDLVHDLRRDLVGAGLLQPLLDEPDVTDVLVNGPSNVWVDRGCGLEPTDVAFADDREVRRLAQRLAASAGRRLDDASPYVDARLVDGVRLHAVLSPIATDGTTISLRVPRRRAFTLDQLTSSGTVDELGAQWLDAIVRARLAFLVSGGTGSGKTTVLGTLLNRVPHDERIVMVEDSAELDPDHPHAVRLQARVANVEGAGQITMRDLVRQALRMRPDRIVVGEVRGAEVVDLLSALNTGHEGGCGTIHANSAADVPARLEALGVTAGLDRQAVHALAFAGVQCVVHLHRSAAGTRVVSGVHVFDRDDAGLLVARPALSRYDGALQAEPAVRLLVDRIGSAGVSVPASARS